MLNKPDKPTQQQSQVEISP